MKNAEAGFRQNTLFAYRTWETVSAAPFMTCAVLSCRPPPCQPVPCQPGLCWPGLCQPKLCEPVLGWPGPRARPGRR